MHEHGRERWSSARAFVLAALGSAVGLGNVWRFSYVAAENGGGAFLLVYLATVLLIGVPLLLAEFGLGRASGSESFAAFHVLAPSSRWRHAGVLGVAVAGLILVYYAVICGWVLKYLALYLVDGGPAPDVAGFAAGFERFIARPVEPVAWQFLALALCAVVVSAGVRGGIETMSKLLMPALALLLLALAAYGATLPGFARGAAFLLQPDWAALAQPRVYLAALGQAFFSIGIGMGVMVAYGSYARPQRSLLGAAVTVALGDALFAVIAGLVIFPAVFTAGLAPAQGPSLAFVVLPQVFAPMPAGGIVGAAFFLLLAIAGLTSAVSLLEVLVSFAVRNLGWRRTVAAPVLALLVGCAGVPASLGFGPWAQAPVPGGRGILGTMDFVAADILLPLNGLLVALFAGWVWARGGACEGCGLRSQTACRVWRFGMRYAMPLVVVGVLAGAGWRP